MPIYEFKCLECNGVLEILVMNQEDEVEIKCPKCTSSRMERIISSTNFNMAPASGGGQGPTTTHRSCSGGNCTTIDLPGPDG